ncbi:MAG: hypothetical protein ACQEQS_05965 [Thermodesulfobacteriota bacterium]
MSTVLAALSKYKICLFVFLLIVSGLSGCRSKNICSNIDMDWLRHHAEFPEEARIINKQETGNLCETLLVVSGQPVFLYCGNDYFISGDMYKNNTIVTKESFSDLSKKIEKETKAYHEKEKALMKERHSFLTENISKLNDFVSFEFGAKDYEDSVFFITDPLCGYCESLLQYLKKVSKEKKLNVKAIIYPVLGDKSKDMAFKAVCKNFGINEYLEMEYDSEPYICVNAEELFEKQEKFFEKADLNFVPFIIEGNGDWIVEGADQELLKEYLK